MGVERTREKFRGPSAVFSISMPQVDNVNINIYSFIRGKLRESRKGFNKPSLALLITYIASGAN